ncbi:MULTISPECIES: mechanosensitive ion channel family protein [Actinomadura]|uniref:Mechanosensitive ion channel n=1 Tax=Actinomadura litoris TaxID=2678616 RepID=A0A7K1L3B5_9ACTN|nr:MULTISPECIES: mechanosensitive ion channel family protein [Actinomadura]MBT2213355.1 mechanosensitive ion channel family protein [Actinomadura sp. NEAU-AAG7]MUN38793.1 mechanosensitive ion channel [Actinomadura litoris]
MSLAADTLLPWAQSGTVENACRASAESDRTPTTACRLVWNISHSTDFTTFYSNWLDKPLATLFMVIVTFVVALIVKNIAHRMITKVTVRMAEGTMSEKVRERSRTVFDGSPTLLNQRRAQRAKTLGSVLRSVASILIMGTAAFSILGSLGLNLAPILASASVIGVAVGFGAQNIVKDFLAGLFMLLEDQYGVGDVIDVGSAKGTVEAVTLRVTRMRDVNGVVWYVPNGEIKKVGNESQNWGRAVLDIPVDIHEDTEKVKEILQTAADELAADSTWQDVILEQPSVWGVQALAGDALVIRVVLKTAPGKQADVARELRERVKRAFDAAGVSVATPAPTA